MKITEIYQGLEREILSEEDYTYFRNTDIKDLNQEDWTRLSKEFNGGNLLKYTTLSFLGVDKKLDNLWRLIKLM